MDKYESLEKSMCKELEALEQKLKGGAEMTIQDLDKIDKLSHAMKSLATYKAMKEAEEYEHSEEMPGYSGEGGNSGRRGRSPMTGRYVSMDGGNSYADGYSQGYSEGMRQVMDRNMSGHWPPVPYPDRYRY